jgi:hypothetical protein
VEEPILGEGALQPKSSLLADNQIGFPHQRGAVISLNSHSAF